MFSSSACLVQILLRQGPQLMPVISLTGPALVCFGKVIENGHGGSKFGWFMIYPWKVMLFKSYGKWVQHLRIWNNRDIKHTEYIILWPRFVNKQEHAWFILCICRSFKFETYTTWLFNIAIENPPYMEVLIGKSSINGPFSMAMLNNQRVTVSET